MASGHVQAEQGALLLVADLPFREGEGTAIRWALAH